MANYLSGARTEYTRVFERFRGVDLSSEQELVDKGRFCHLVNMWRDYDSGQGDAIETIPGFRVLNIFDGRINGIFRYRTRAGVDFVVVHAGTKLHRFRHAERDRLGGDGVVETFEGMADARSTAFTFADKLYLLDGTTYRRLDESGLCAVSEVAYEPKTSVDGEEYEQANMLGGRSREQFSVSEAIGTDVTGIYCADFYQFRHENNTEVVPDMVNDDFGMEILGKAVIVRTKGFILSERYGNPNLEVLIIKDNEFYTESIYVSINDGFLKKCTKLREVYMADFASREQFDTKKGNHVSRVFDESLLPEGCEVHWGTEPDISKWYAPIMVSDRYSVTIEATACTVRPIERSVGVESVQIDDAEVPYNVVFKEDSSGRYVSSILLDPKYQGKLASVMLKSDTREFHSSGEYLDFYTGNPEYKGTAQDAINRCTVVCQFDGRLFFTGNPDLPNTIFYTQRDLTGYNNPTYVGILNYMNDGVGNTPNTAMVAAQGTLMVFKADTAQDGSVYYHSGVDTNDNIMPRIYPSSAGVPGIGCLGAAVNFYDDVCFLSARGLESVGKQQTNLERTIEHRSSNVDRALTAEALRSASIAEWMGYLVILCGERAYLADSRQIFTHSTGVAQYEWYVLDDLCTYMETRPCYRGTEAMPWVEVDGEEVSLGDFASADGTRLVAVGNGEDIDKDEEIRSGEFDLGADKRILHYVLRDGVAYYVEPTGEVRGVGERAEARVVAEVDGVLYFGTADGSLCCINTDKRGQAYTEDGMSVEVESDQIYRLYYTHAGRRYLSGFATPPDNCGYPHLLKSTVKKSCVLKMKSLSGGGLRVQSRTDDTPWRQVQRSGGAIEQVITTDVGGFDDADFGAVNYNGFGGITVPIMEKEKKWVEKQLYLYSDGYAQPFGIFGLAYRFTLRGRIKK